MNAWIDVRRGFFDSDIDGPAVNVLTESHGHSTDRNDVDFVACNVVQAVFSKRPAELNLLEGKVFFHRPGSCNF